MLMRAALGITLLVGAMVLPFLPGRHDPLAAPLSVAASVFAFGSLLLVPIGVTWLVTDRGYAPAKVALVVVPLVAVATRMTLVSSAAVWSCDRAIANAAPLIADIEALSRRSASRTTCRAPRLREAAFTATIREREVPPS